MGKYVCSCCGCDEIEFKMWVTANTNIITDCVDDGGSRECWCPECNEITTYRYE